MTDELDDHILHAAQPMGVLDREGRFILVNRPACKLTGYGPDELQGRHFSVLVPPEQVEWAVQQLSKTLTAGWQFLQLETTIVRKNGTSLVVRYSLIPLFEKGEIVGAVGFGEDITEQTRVIAEQARVITEQAQVIEQLRDSEALFRALVERWPAGMVVLEADGTIRLANAAACELLGFTETDLISKSVHDTDWDVLRKDGTRCGKEDCLVVHALATGAPARMVMGILRRRRGDRVWLEVHITPLVVDERVRTVLCSFSEITAHRELERRFERETGFTRLHERERFGLARLVGQSRVMHDISDQIRRAAERQEAPVLLFGEPGTGKEVVARAIHAESPRAKGPFVPVNCGSLSSSLIESELFGYEKGAFTGAMAVKRGLFEQADGGTILLDEIGDLPLQQQATLLRVLQEHTVRRVGATKEIPIDVRIVAATNRDLESEVQAGRFRADLFDRLDVLEIHLPPLRDRGAEDITLLAEHFVRESSARHGSPAPRLTLDLLRALHCYHWPGNVRQLQNVIERILARATGHELTLEFLPALPPRSQAHGALRKTYTKAEIEESLARHQGNVTQTAKALGIPRTTLYWFMDKYRIPRRT